MRLSCSSRFPKISFSAFSCQPQSRNGSPHQSSAVWHSTSWKNIQAKSARSCENGTSGRRDAGALLQDPQGVVLVVILFPELPPVLHVLERRAMPLERGF